MQNKDSLSWKCEVVEELSGRLPVSEMAYGTVRSSCVCVASVVLVALVLVGAAPTTGTCTVTLCSANLHRM